jgi:hypothetical protein
MTKLQKNYEKTVRLLGGHLQHQVLQISTMVKDVNHLAIIDYKDFECNLYVNGLFIADISHVLAKTNQLAELVDETNWLEIFNETINQKEVCHG